MTYAAKVNSLAAYLDVSTVLDAALATAAPPGAICGSVAFETRGKAVHWRHRAYTFRKQYREVYGPNSPYEQLTLPQIAEESCEVVIKMQGRAVTFVPAAPEAPKFAPAVDELQEEANALMARQLKDLP